MIIKNVLEEELRNSLKLKEKYEEALRKLPKGSLIKKNIKGHDYYYLLFRQNGKVKFVYQGKQVKAEEIKKYQEWKEQREKYKKLISEVNEEIKFLGRSLRVRKAI